MVVKSCYTVYAVDIVYPLVITLFRNKVISVVDKLRIDCSYRRYGVFTCSNAVDVVGVFCIILVVAVSKQSASLPR